MGSAEDALPGTRTIALPGAARASVASSQSTARRAPLAAQRSRLDLDAFAAGGPHGFVFVGVKDRQLRRLAASQAVRRQEERQPVGHAAGTKGPG